MSGLARVDSLTGGRSLAIRQHCPDDSIMANPPMPRWVRLFVGLIVATTLIASFLLLGNHVSGQGQPGKGAGQSKGRSSQMPTPADMTAALAKQILVAGVKNGDGKLSKDQFMALADAWFDILDPDKQGKLTQETLARTFGRLLPESEQGFGVQLFL